MLWISAAFLLSRSCISFLCCALLISTTCFTLSVTILLTSSHAIEYCSSPKTWPHVGHLNSVISMVIFRQPRLLLLSHLVSESASFRTHKDYLRSRFL